MPWLTACRHWTGEAPDSSTCKSQPHSLELCTCSKHCLLSSLSITSESVSGSDSLSGLQGSRESESHLQVKPGTGNCSPGHVQMLSHPRTHRYAGILPLHIPCTLDALPAHCSFPAYSAHSLHTLFIPCTHRAFLAHTAHSLHTPRIPLHTQGFPAHLVHSLHPLRIPCAQRAFPAHCAFPAHHAFPAHTELTISRAFTTGETAPPTVLLPTDPFGINPWCFSWNGVQCTVSSTGECLGALDLSLSGTGAREMTCEALVNKTRPLSGQPLLFVPALPPVPLCCRPLPLPKPTTRPRHQTNHTLIVPRISLAPQGALHHILFYIGIYKYCSQKSHRERNSEKNSERAGGMKGGIERERHATVSPKGRCETTLPARTVLDHLLAPLQPHAQTTDSILAR